MSTDVYLFTVGTHQADDIVLHTSAPLSVAGTDDEAHGRHGLYPLGRRRPHRHEDEPTPPKPPEWFEIDDLTKKIQAERATVRRRRVIAALAAAGAL